jgi:hypothetical protein
LGLPGIAKIAIIAVIAKIAITSRSESLVAAYIRGATWKMKWRLCQFWQMLRFEWVEVRFSNYGDYGNHGNFGNLVNVTMAQKSVTHVHQHRFAF